MDTTYNTLGIDPNVQIVGTSKSNNKLLLRGKLNDKTIRYVACYSNDGNFKYFTISLLFINYSSIIF